MPNRLQLETSPYLLQHADNPVDWFPWGPEALARARSESKPIFLSIGYAACHWCHVMAHETFDDPQVAAFMNGGFVNIKVDREERPDLDSIYMQAVVAMGGQGGWPLSVFLTPEAKPFFGGTYFPPTRRHGLPAFREVLEAVVEAWRDRRDQVQASSGQIAAHLDEKTASAQAPPLDPLVLDRAADALFRTYDWSHGGWGGAPKFPQPLAIEVLLERFHRRHDSLALDMATHALRSMAHGGMFDVIGGGFHRYSVDNDWLVPHFEKMLYDNALLGRVYLHAWQVTGEPLFLDVADQTLGFLLREMRDPAGGFYSSLDADSEGEEGKYYWWTPYELRQAIQEPGLAGFALAAFGITAEGNFEGRSLARMSSDLEGAAQRAGLDPAHAGETLLVARAAMLAGRSRRVRPGCDDKVLAEWNGLLLQTLAEGARATGRREYREAASSLGSFLADRMMTNGRLCRSYREGQTHGTGFLGDYAAVGQGFLALYQTDFDLPWLRQAQAMAEVILVRFADPAGGFFDTPDDHELLITRPKSVQDGPLPSGNASVVSLMLRLHALTGEDRYLTSAESSLRAVQSEASRYPIAFAAWLSALDFALGPVRQVAVVGDPGSRSFQSLLAIAQKGYAPRLVAAAGPAWQPGFPRLLEGRTPIDGRPAAYLCEGFVCREPTMDPRELEAQLRSEAPQS